MTEGTQGFPARFPQDLYERLRQAAFDERRPMNAIVVRATERELDVIDKAAADKAVVAEALSEYQASRQDPEPPKGNDHA